MTAQYNVPLGYAQARFVFTCAGLVDPMGCTLGVVQVNANPANAAGDINQAFVENILMFSTLMAEGWTYLGTDLTTQLQGGPSMDHVGVPLSGTIPSATPPPNCALLIRKVTALGGRKNRGRMFMPPATTYETQVDNAGFFAGATVTALQERWTNFFDALVAAGHTPYLFHQYDPDLGELPEIPTEITSLSVQSQLATQRLRMR